MAVAIWRVRPLIANVAGLHTIPAALVLGICGAVVLLVASSQFWRQMPAVLAVGAAMSFAVLQYGGISGTGDDTVEQVARAVRAAAQNGEEVGTHRVFVRNLVFYTGRRTVDLITDDQLDAFLGQQARALLVAPVEAIERLEQRTGRHYPRLAEFAYFNEAGIRVRTLMQPDAERDLARVALVANR